jgi:hypothetical protein
MEPSFAAVVAVILNRACRDCGETAFLFLGFQHNKALKMDHLASGWRSRFLVLKVSCTEVF